MAHRDAFVLSSVWEGIGVRVYDIRAYARGEIISTEVSTGFIPSDMEKLFYYLLGMLGLRKRDVIFSSYPRSGSTWVRFIFCYLIKLLEPLEREITYENMNEIMVELGSSNLLLPWGYTSLPRVVKTHLSYYKILDRNGTMLGIIRDPRDVMVSYFHYQKDRRKNFPGEFGEFIRDNRFGLEAWFTHYLSWKTQWDFILRYEALQRNTIAEMNKLLHWLEVDVPRELLEEAVRRSSFSKIKALEREYKAVRNQRAKMVRRGKPNQWTGYFQEHDLAYYHHLRDHFQVKIYQ